jgi:O-antigen biosynthesis protein
MHNDELDPLVSVILPIHNRADVVADAIQSVLNQTYTNIELVVVDDGSTDDSSAVVQALADSRTIALATKARSGVSAARNLGLAKSTGELIAFQDSDDVWLPRLWAPERPCSCLSIQR